MKNFRAAVVQMDTGACWEQNKKQAADFVKEAAEKGAQYVQLPETSEYIGEDMAGFARAHCREVYCFYGELAAQNGIYLHCGSITWYGADGRCRNTSLLFAPDGKCVSKYEKLHLFDVEVTGGAVYRESEQIEPGREIVRAALPFAQAGLSICYDLRFPELYRHMAAGGAEMLCVAANFTKKTGASHWELLLRARAVENTCFVLASGQCGQKREFEAYGHSMAVDPWGEILLELGDEPGIGLVELESKRLGEVRRQIPSLSNRRRDLFGF